MGDAMDDAFADDEDEEEEEAIVGAILAELDVNVAGSMASATPGMQDVAAGAAEQAPLPQAAGGGPAAAGGAGGEDLDAELQKRRDNLRKR